MLEENKIMGRVLAAFLAIMFAVNSAEVGATSISPQGGKVYVNTGKGFHPISDAVEVGPGALVLVRKGGAARISYGNACSVKVDGSRVWHIAKQPPCRSGERTINLTNMKSYVGGHNDPGDANSWDTQVTTSWETKVTPANPAPAAAAPVAGAISSSALVIGGLAVAGGVGLAVAAGGGGGSGSSNDNPAPASP